MKILEQKYGVPTFKTCKKLSEYWKKETTFCFLSCNKTGSSKLHFNKENLHGGSYYESVNGTFVHTDFVTVYAPQIHELLEVLPKYISFANNDIELFHYFISGNLVAYENGYGDMFIGYSITEERPLIECLAFLYLELKEKELL